MSATQNWRNKPFARVVVYCSCNFMLITSSAPLYAAPPVNQLPQAAANWLQAGAASHATVGNTMTIDQTSSKAILNWNGFNIGKDAAVQFNQPSASAIALNKIGGGSASEIFGRLGANGTIYLINNNGILFGQGAQVNVHGLVASTLNIDDNLFLSSSLSQAMNNGNAALSGVAATGPIPNNPCGAGAGACIKIDAGAKIQTDSGGQVLMFAPTVINGGDIATPDGQTILAASHDRVYLTTSENDPDLRGLLVEVDTGGNVSNVGNIVAERGNVTLLGLAVNQSGRIRATTSVDVNGSVRLLARDRAHVVVNEPGQAPNAALLVDDFKERPTAANVALATRAGTLTLGSGSVTEVVADEQRGANGSVKTAADAQPQNKSRIDIVGKNITLENGASILAKSGHVNLRATATPDNPLAESVARNDSRIYVGNNVTIDVSGEDVELPMSRRVIEVELRGDQLKDSPLQRNGILRGAKVYVDIDKGSPLIADMKPELARIQRDVKERSTAGGSVSFDAQGDVIFGGAANIDIGGGSVSYAAGLVNTTKLLSNGRIIDIGSADPNLQYDGILGGHTEIHPKWGKSVFGSDSVFARGTYREGFSEGAAGGALKVDAEALYGFDLLTIDAASRHGIFQRAADKAALGGSIAIALSQHVPANAALATVQEVIFQQAAASAALDAAASIPLDSGKPQALAISAEQINRSGAGSFSLLSNGRIALGATAALRLQPGTSIALTGTSLQIDGSITAPGGSIALASRASNGAEGLGNFPVSIGSNALLDVSGLWINDRLDPRATIPLAIDGGSIRVTGAGDVAIAAGAHLRADGGGRLAGGGAFAGGDGGSIALTTRARTENDAGSYLRLDGDLSAYGFGNGGALTLTANAFQIGGTAANQRTVLLAPDFFARGGFGSFALNANFGGIDVAPGAVIHLQQQNSTIVDIVTAAAQQTGADIRAFSERVQLPSWLRKAVDLSLTVADSISRISTPARVLSIGRDARIEAEPGASIALTSDRSIFVDGAINAAGGNIGLELAVPDAGADSGYVAGQSIWLAEHARLQAGAAQVLRDNPAGLRLGTLYDAGNVSLLARRGAIVAAPGSLIDVSGAGFTQDYLDSSSRAGYRTAQVYAAAGSIGLRAAEAIAVYGDLQGFAAGGDGLGGQLSVRVDTGLRGERASGSPFLYTPRELRVSAAQPAWNPALVFGQALPAGLADAAQISAAQVSAGGFSKLELGAANVVRNGSVYAAASRISFTDDLALTLADSLLLDSANIALNNHAVALNAGIVGIGQSSGNNLLQRTDNVQAGTGRLSVAARFIELLGNIGISGASTVALSSAGDIRVRSHIDNGSGRTLAAARFTTPGNLTLQAAQIYPSTLTDYLFELTGADSVFTTAASGGARTPLLSAGGALRVQAPAIDHGGVLAAPLGTIELNATQRIRLGAGSVIDVSGGNQLIPFGRLQGGEISWIYPVNPDSPLLIDKLPEKQVRLNARDVLMEAGSRVELSGGGDIYAIEQVPGPGGSQDFLDAAYAKGAFAVIPALHSAISPYDVVEMRGAGLSIGQTIYLEGGNGLPAGEYAVLPAHYALLPGAYLISPSGKTVAAGSSSARSDGVPLVSGRFGRAFAAQYDAQWQGFYIEPGTAARTRTEYTEARGDNYFADRNIDLAADAGLIGISARERLLLDGTIGAAAQNGHGAQMDIVADLLEIVADSAQTAGGDGVVRVDANALSRIGIDSLLLGGSRRRDGDGIAVNVQSNRVTIGAGAQLAAPDLIIAAKERVAVAAGAAVAGTGSSSQNYTMLNVDSHAGSGEGALLRVSSAGQVDVERSGAIPASGATGVLDIAEGATLRADKSMLLDATGAMALDGAIAMQGGSLNLSANRISLGENIGSVEGVIFDNAKLASLTPAALRFSSRSSIDFYGDVEFLNQRAELNAGALRAMTPGTVQVRASDTLQLSNTAGATAAPVGDSGGGLLLAAQTIELGSERDKGTTLQLGGFDRVQLGAAGLTRKVTGNGEFDLDVARHLDVVADLITGAAGSATTLRAGGVVTLAKAAAPATAAQAGDRSALGASLRIEGSRIDHRSTIAMPSGSVLLSALGAAADDGVMLRDGSSIDVSGRTVQFPNNAVRTAGGNLRLQAGAGDVVAEAGSRVSVGGSEGAAGGLLDIAAASGRVVWNGSVSAAGGLGYQGGSLKLDAGEISDLIGWLERIASAGIDDLVSVRSRTGDIALDRNVTARAIDVAADAGSLSVTSTLDASGGAGGSITLSASDNLTLAGSALLRARAADAGGRGGRVELSTRGVNAGALNFASGSRMDVAGNGGRNGQVVLRAPRTAGNDEIAISDNGVAITGAERIDVIGVEQRSSSVFGNALVAQIDAAANAFMANATAIQARLGNLFAHDHTYLRPGAEVASTGDLTVTESVDFGALRYGSDRQGAELTLRAAGNLILQGDLLDGFTAAHDSIADGLGLIYNTLFSNKAWDYRLVAGADLAAAKSSTTVNGNGDLRINGGADVITGAGDIALYAGRDIVVERADSVVASLGNQQFTEYTSRFDSSWTDLLADTGTFDPYLLFLLGLRFPLYPENGGNVSFSAGQDVRFAKSSHFFGDWIERIGGEVTVDDGTGVAVPPFNLTTWGVLLDDIQNEQGVALFGGGNLNVAAGRDVVNLFATVATTGKQDGVGVNHVSVSGGGDASVFAGRDILSPRVMVDKGKLRLTAGRDIAASGTGTTDFNAVLALADTAATLQAGRNINVDAVINSTVMPQSSRQVFETTLAENYFFTYSNRARVELQSLSGDIQLLNRAGAVSSYFAPRYASNSTDSYAFAIYPAVLSASAVQNSIYLHNGMTLFPSTTGQLVLNAAQDVVGVVGSSNASLNLPDVDPASLASVGEPSKFSDFRTLKLDQEASVIQHGAQPLHLVDQTLALINALYGDIRADIAEGSFASFKLVINKALQAVAGRDIANTNFYIQHSADSQVSELVAGRDLGFPLQVNPATGILATNDNQIIEIAGPGRLDVIAGRNIDLGGSQGINSIGNQKNPALANSGADITLMAGINGATAFSDPQLYAAFAARYLALAPELSGTFVDWFDRGNFAGDSAMLVSTFTGQAYAASSAALADYRKLPVLTQQSIALAAYQIDHADQSNHGAALIDFVSLDRFGGDLVAAVNDNLKPAQPYTTRAEAAAVLALLPAARQQQIALQAFAAATPTARRELLGAVLFDEVRGGGIENANGLAGKDSTSGFARSRAAIELMFPGDDWHGNVNLVLSTVRTLGDGDINLLVPGGDINVGLASNIKGINKASGSLGILAQRYGSINGIASGDINVNQSRIFSLDGGDISLWSSAGDIDAGRGAKTALTIPPPTVKIDPITGNTLLEFPPAVAGSGIQTAGNARKRATDRGALVDDSIASSSSDTRTSRQRYFNSLRAGDVYLFAPQGVINAGDAGISVGGNLLLAAQQVIGADNISVGGISIGVPTTTSIGAGTLSLGDVASSATESATNSMNDAIKEAAAALAESTAAFVTVDIIGVGD